MEDAVPLIDVGLPALDALPDCDFLNFLGDLDATDALMPDLELALPPTTSCWAPTSASPAAASGPQAASSWQVTTGLQADQRQLSGGSSCSSEASALPEVAAGSPTATPVCPGSPATSSDAAHPTPSSAGSTGTTSTARRRTQRVTVAAATQRQLQRAAAAGAGAPAAAANPTDQGVEEEPQLTRAQLAAAKRRAPVVDWRAIDDPEERRKQRRLAKNRITAARSRERKKGQVADMEQRLAQLESDNSSLRALLQNLAAENTTLKEQLASLARGAAAAPNTPGSSPKPAVLDKCLAIMHLVCCLLMCVEASLGVVLPLLPALMQQGARAFDGSWLHCGSCDSSSRPRVVVPVAVSCIHHNTCSAAKVDGGRRWRRCGGAAVGPDATPEWWRMRLRQLA